MRRANCSREYQSIISFESIAREVHGGLIRQLFRRSLGSASKPAFDHRRSGKELPIGPVARHEEQAGRKAAFRNGQGDGAEVEEIGDDLIAQQLSIEIEAE